MNYKYLILKGPYKKRKKPRCTKAWLLRVITVFGIAIILYFLQSCNK